MVLEFAFQNAVDFFTDRVELPAAVASHQNEIVELRRHRPHVEERDILSSIVFGRTGSSERKLFAAFLATFKRGGCVGDGNPLAQEGTEKRGPILTFDRVADEGKER
jgi:hypothetical protein